MSAKQTFKPLLKKIYLFIHVRHEQWQKVQVNVNTNYLTESLSMPMSMSFLWSTLLSMFNHSSFNGNVNANFSDLLINVNDNVNFSEIALPIANGNINASRKSMSMAPAILLLMSDSHYWKRWNEEEHIWICKSEIFQSFGWYQ